MSDTLRFAVIGSGPSGFYAAEALMRSQEACRVDMFERLATPHGLVRYGVAPDHQKLKQVTAVFDGIAKDPRFRMFAGVEVGQHLSIDELRARYHAVVLAVGSPVGRQLKVPNESLPQVFTSARFVGWYNGHPDCANVRPDLGGGTALVVGNGNVALDVCRLLVRPFDDLRRSDIPEPALSLFRRRGIRRVHVVGRSAVTATKFTFKEFRQLVDQAGLRTEVPQAAGWSNADWEGREGDGSEDARRIAQWLREHASCDGGGDGPAISFWFNAAPTSFCDDAGALSGARLRPAGAGPEVPEYLPCDLAVTCIGYETPDLPGMPHRVRLGATSHREGQVIASDHTEVPGLFVAGWAKRGPTGIIGTNRADAYETVQTIVARLPELIDRKLHAESIESVFAERSIQPLSYAQWLRIDQWERQRGAELGKPREKAITAEQIAAARISAE